MEKSTSGYRSVRSSLGWMSTWAVCSESHLGRGSETLMSLRQMAQEEKATGRGGSLYPSDQAPEGRGRESGQSAR